MNEFIQVIGNFASIFSVPLAIILYIMANEKKQKRVCKEIVRSLSYRYGEEVALARNEVLAVYNSKLREHNIRRARFSVSEVLEDIVAEVVTSPFLLSDNKTRIIEIITQSQNAFSTAGDFTDTSKEAYGRVFMTEKKKRLIFLELFSFATTILASILALYSSFFDPIFLEWQKTSVFENLPTSILLSVLITFFGFLLVGIVLILQTKIKKL